MQRQFQYAGGDRVLSVSEPQIDEDAWSVNVRLEDASGQTVWEHVIYGIDEVQATLLGLHFAKTRLLDDGGYRFLGGTDLIHARSQPRIRMSICPILQNRSLAAHPPLTRVSDSGKSVMHASSERPRLSDSGESDTVTIATRRNCGIGTIGVD